MKFLRMNPKGNLYYVFVDGKPHKNLENFLKAIGAVEEPGTDGMLWKLPKLSEETICRYFEQLTGIQQTDLNEMVKYLENILSSSQGFLSKAQKDRLRGLLELIRYFIFSKG
ncbi:MAG: hypothetical protein DRN92_05475 [Thermoproteota archaeon]|nr:MAG: hypothetical protein DRN92_05475 [Candidatus Korarchaeota archaeon]